MKISELETKIGEYLKDAERDTQRLAAFLKDKLRFGDLRSEAVTAVKLQRPDAWCVKTAQEWRKLGVRLKQGEFANAIKVLTTCRDTSFERDGRIVSVRDATAEERKAMLSGELPVQEKLITRMVLVYDISQTDCPRDRYQQITQSQGIQPSHGQLYELLKAQIDDKGVTVEEVDLHRTGANAMYVQESKVILVDQSLKDYQKLAALCDGYAECLVTETSNQLESVARFEAAFTALALKQEYGLPIAEGEVQKAAELYHKIDGHDVQTLDSSLTRCRRVQEHVTADVAVRHQELLKAQGLDLSLSQSQVAQNFLQDLG